MEIHLKKQSLSGGFTTSGKARQLKSFCNLTNTSVKIYRAKS